MKLSVSYQFLPKRRSTRTSVVMDHFGIGFETGKHIIAEELELPVHPGDVVCFTGASGSGKSSLMRAAAEQLAGVLNVDELTLPEETLVDAMPLPVEQSLPVLSACGLGEAHLLLRSPAELSDGQRYRFRLALAVAQKPQWIVADEFTATLDRTLAKVIAFNIHRVSHRTGIGFLLATTHEDILHDLSPALHVQCRLDGDIQWHRSDKPENTASSSDESGAAIAGRKKKDASPLPGNSTSRPAPKRTGRTSLGGITAATIWAS